jgi:hypothetical protein
MANWERNQIGNIGGSQSNLTITQVKDYAEGQIEMVHDIMGKMHQKINELISDPYQDEIKFIFWV